MYVAIPDVAERYSGNISSVPDHDLLTGISNGDEFTWLYVLFS
jgi:hypothetical protein